MLTAQALLHYAQYLDSFMPGAIEASPDMIAMYGHESVQRVLRDYADFGVGHYNSHSGCQCCIQYWHEEGWIKGKKDQAMLTAQHVLHYAQYLDSFTPGAPQASPDMIAMYSNASVQEVLRDYADFVLGCFV